jgi:hypothetical protein
MPFNNKMTSKDNLTVAKNRVLFCGGMLSGLATQLDWWAMLCL